MCSQEQTEPQFLTLNAAICRGAWPSQKENEGSITTLRRTMQGISPLTDADWVPDAES